MKFWHVYPKILREKFLKNKEAIKNMIPGLSIIKDNMKSWRNYKSMYEEIRRILFHPIKKEILNCIEKSNGAF